MMNKRINETSLVERHALKRLANVEKNQQKAYKKKNNNFSWKNLIMGLIFILILLLILFQLMKK